MSLKRWTKWTPFRPLSTVKSSSRKPDTNHKCSWSYKTRTNNATNRVLSGFYEIQCHRKGSLFPQDGNGWLTWFSRRSTAGKSSTSFKVGWNDYKNGFGSIEQKNFWLGLEKLHQITTSLSCDMLVVQFRPNTPRHRKLKLTYKNFTVLSKDKSFAVTHGKIKWTHRKISSAQHVLERCNLQHRFSTKDRKTSGCPSERNGDNTGWWYDTRHSKNCGHMFPTAPWPPKNWKTTQGNIHMYLNWRCHWVYMPEIEMNIKCHKRS